MLLQSKLLAAHGFAHAFPTRDIKDAELCAFLGTDRVVQVKQVHGGCVVGADAPPETEADAIVARRDGTQVGLLAENTVAVGVRVADCVPVLVADSHSGDVAAVHAGWRGVVARVVPIAIAALGGGPLVIAIGPCIGACCFEVDLDVAERIGRACDGTAAPIVVRAAAGKAYVDLRTAVRAQLLALGVAEGSIDDVPGCTKHEPQRFHSYRRDGASSGRMLAAIATRR
jgi:YfiH family protein